MLEVKAKENGRRPGPFRHSALPVREARTAAVMGLAETPQPNQGDSPCDLNDTEGAGWERPADHRGRIGQELSPSLQMGDVRRTEGPLLPDQPDEPSHRVAGPPQRSDTGQEQHGGLAEDHRGRKD